MTIRVWVDWIWKCKWFEKLQSHHATHFAHPCYKQHQLTSKKISEHQNPFKNILRENFIDCKIIKKNIQFNLSSTFLLRTEFSLRFTSFRVGEVIKIYVFFLKSRQKKEFFYLWEFWWDFQEKNLSQMKGDENNLF